MNGDRLDDNDVERIRCVKILKIYNYSSVLNNIFQFTLYNGFVANGSQCIRLAEFEIKFACEFANRSQKIFRIRLSLKIEVEMNDGSQRSRTLPRFSGDKGVEGLFYVYDEFISQAADRLGFKDEDYWTYWPDVLDPVARRKWKQRVDGIAAEDQTSDHFREEFSRFVTLYSNSACPRDDLIKYLQSEECRKPRKVNPDDHAMRIETLCLSTNRLED